MLLRRRLSFFVAEETRVAEEEIRVVEGEDLVSLPQRRLVLLRRGFIFFAAEETRVAEEGIRFLCCRGDSCC